MSLRFQNIRDEVVGQYGYDNTKPEPVAAGNSPQDMYTAKTMMRCDCECSQLCSGQSIFLSSASLKKFH